MLQMLLISWSDIEVSMISGVYKVVARVYDIMIKLVQDSRDITGSNFNDLIVTCYVLAGVFMLFRIALSLVQMLINPEQVNDKQAGAGKMITRVVVSIILLLLLRPDGFLFAPYDESAGTGGLLPRIEYALVSADDGLVINLVNSRLDSDTSEVAYTEKPAFTSNVFSTNFLVEEVQAASMKKDLTCYFVQKARQVQKLKDTGDSKKTTAGITPGIAGSAGTAGGKYAQAGKEYDKEYDKSLKKGTSFGVIKLTFSSKKNGKKIKNTKDGYTGYVVNHAGESETVPKYGNSYTFINYYNANSYSAETGVTPTYKALFIDSYPKSCSEIVLLPSNTKSDKVPTVAVVARATNKNKKRKSDYATSGGYGSFAKAYERFLNESGKTQEAGYNLEGFIDPNALDQVPKTQRDYLKNIDPKAIDFAQGTASSFQECADGQAESCSEVQSRMFLSTKGDEDLAKLAEDGNIELGFLISMIAGIGLIVYIALLCVEVIIRRFKLLLLEVMAPIPAISFINPKDKIFNQWMKMYISTYLDLFIKLIAIALAIGLLNTVMGPNSTVWEDKGLIMKFFYIVAILVFAKTIPSMISKIFGLDSMGGSFKDILGMGKAALGFGAGAALGGLAGFATGKGLGRISGLTKGLAMGAGSGAKGNIFGGSQGISAKNAKINQQKADGLNLAQRLLVGMGGATGIALGAGAAKKMEKAQDVLEAQDKYKKYLLDQVKKKNALFSAGDVNNGAAIMDKGGNRIVANADEDINMKEEYAKQSSLAGMTMDKWNSMGVYQRKREFGELVGGQTSLTQAQILQNDRVAALEDFAAPEMARTLYDKGDQEAIKEYNSYSDAVSKAQGAGVAVESLPGMDSFNNKTISKSKDQALAGYNKAASSSTVKVQKHIDSK